MSITTDLQEGKVDEFIDKTGWEITSYPDSKMISIRIKNDS